MKVTACVELFQDELGATTWLNNYKLDDYARFTPFCPVARQICTRNCICYEEPKVVKVRISSYPETYGWRFYSEYCSNPMLTGDRQSQC